MDCAIIAGFHCYYSDDTCNVISCVVCQNIITAGVKMFQTSFKCGS